MAISSTGVINISRDLIERKSVMISLISLT